jgi:twinkle protein
MPSGQKRRILSNIVEQHITCDRCGSSDAKCVWNDGHGFCFSCQTYFPSDEKRLNNLNTFEYVPWRGITEETMRFYGTKSKIDPEGKPISVYFQWPNGSYMIRNREEKSFYTEGDIAKGGLFGRDKFSAGSSKFVTICEGALDAQSLYQVINSPVVSVRSSTTAAADCILDRSWLDSFERIYLCLDNDTQGRRASAEIAKLFDYNRVLEVKLTKHKDPNAYLQAGEEIDLRRIWWNSKHYLPETVVSSLSEFEDILNKPIEVGFPYPWQCLTDMTYGIRKSESVLITAPEGVGKTEIMHAIEYKILTESNDNVGAIYLEEPKRRHLQSLAGLRLGRPCHIPQLGSREDDVISAIKEVVGSDDRLHLYNHFGSSNPDILLDTIRFLVSARQCWYVLLDHITLGVGGAQGEDERKALDYLSNRLEMMVKELAFALILVSHVNDNGQTRGSRNISKVADIRIDLTRDLTSADNQVRNTTNLVISKNRFCGKTGPAGKLLFNPITYSLAELIEPEEIKQWREDPRKDTLKMNTSQSEFPVGI